MTTDSNIRHFPGAEVPEQTLSVEREPFGYCAHDKISLDEHSRTVRCAKCDKVFDPFDFLKNEALLAALQKFPVDSQFSPPSSAKGVAPA